MLLGVGGRAGAHDLAGSAAECGLKACIARPTDLHEFPDKDRVVRGYSHKVEVLVEPANPRIRRDADAAADPALDRNRLIARSWSEAARPSRTTGAQARELFAAIAHPTEGVLQWIMGRR